MKSPVLLLLGPPSVCVAGKMSPLTLRPKAVALVAYLAMAKGAVLRSELSRLLFPDAEAPLAALRWHLTHVRRAAPSFVARGLITTRDSLTLSVRTDVAVFRGSIDALCAHPGARSGARTLALYRGDLVAGLTVSASAEFDNWLYVEQEGLRRRFRQAVLAFTRCALAAGRSDGAVDGLARLVTVDPYCEDAHVLLIRAYEALGRTEAARSSYDRYQHIVRSDLAAEPQPALVRRFEGRLSRGRILPRERLIALKDVTLHVVEWDGDGPPIVMIHGSAGMAHTCGALAERLAPSHRIIALDLRGHGFSDKPPAGYDLASHVRDLSELIRVLRLRRPILLGHSAGGTIATFVAAGTDVRGLILLEAMIGNRAFTENAVAQASPLVTNLAMPVANFDAYLAAWRARRARFSDEAERLVDRWARFAFSPLPDGRYRQRALRMAVEAEWRSIVEADSLGALARVACPVLIVQAVRPWLDGRPYFTRAVVDAQMKAVRSGVLFVATESDHMTLIRDPDPAMVDAIRSFARPSSPTLRRRDRI
jgi:pimeloyl-ACP methyl ester carboxylesterase/DNA-binding SARP family transcriptional activator